MRHVMRVAGSLFLMVAAISCGSATDTGPTRYNFAIIDGLDQSGTAGTTTLPKPITAQLTKDPEGRFAARVIDFLLPLKAFAQGLTLPGQPVVGALVCGREAEPGEPTVEPLCGFTLTDGKAPKVVKPGTKAGTYNIVFSAQAVGESPIKDSTTVTVEAGPMVVNRWLSYLSVSGLSPHTFDNGPEDVFVQDAYGNRVPYRLEVTGPAHVLGTELGTLDARTIVADPEGLCSNNCSGDISTRPEHWGTLKVVTKAGTIATGSLSVSFNNPGWAIRLADFK